MWSFVLKCRHFRVEDSIHTQRWADSFPLGSIRLAGSGGCVPPSGDFDTAAPPSRCPAPRTPSAHRPQRSCSGASASSPAACQWPATPASVGIENKSDDIRGCQQVALLCIYLSQFKYIDNFSTSSTSPDSCFGSSDWHFLRFFPFCFVSWSTAVSSLFQTVSFTATKTQSPVKSFLLFQTWSRSPPPRSWPIFARSLGRRGKCRFCSLMRWNWPRKRQMNNRDIKERKHLHGSGS